MSRKNPSKTEKDSSTKAAAAKDDKGKDQRKDNKEQTTLSSNSSRLVYADSSKSSTPLNKAQGDKKADNAKQQSYGTAATESGKKVEVDKGFLRDDREEDSNCCVM